MNDELEFEHIMAQLFREDGGVFRIRDLEKQLKVMNYPIPGKGTAANILTRLRRAKNRFARVGVGRYALLPIQNLPQFLEFYVVQVFRLRELDYLLVQPQQHVILGFVF